jgi:hypothetical protein
MEREEMGNIIGIMGKMGTGKTTVSEILIKEYGFTRIKFSTPLKKMLEVLGLSPEQLEERDKETPIEWLGGITPRHLMQTLGTDWGRQMIHPNLWCILLEKKILCQFYPGSNLVCDDLRFYNEVQMLKGFSNTRIWEIQRSGIPLSSHLSETSLDDFTPDGVLVNDGTIEDLAKSIETSLKFQ